MYITERVLWPGTRRLRVQVYSLSHHRGCYEPHCDAASYRVESHPMGSSTRLSGMFVRPFVCMYVCMYVC